MLLADTATAVEDHIQETETKREDVRRVLIVDDNVSVHECFQKILSPPDHSDSELDEFDELLFGGASATFEHEEDGAKFELASAYQGAESLAMIEKADAADEPFAAVFMDVRMPPGWNGIETTKRIWDRFPNLPVVLCTAYSDWGWREIVEELGQRETLLVLKKPFEAVEVHQLAYNLTSRYRSHKSQVNRELDLQLSLHRARQDGNSTDSRIRECEQQLHRFARMAKGLGRELEATATALGTSPGDETTDTARTQLERHVAELARVAAFDGGSLIEVDLNEEAEAAVDRLMATDFANHDLTMHKQLALTPPFSFVPGEFELIIAGLSSTAARWAERQGRITIQSETNFFVEYHVIAERTSPAHAESLNADQPSSVLTWLLELHGAKLVTSGDDMFRRFTVRLPLA